MRTTLILALCLVAPATADPPQKYVPTRDELARAYERASQPPRGRVYKDQVRPNWFHNNTRFWYRNDLPREAREFVLVDAVAGQRGPAFDHARLARALSKAAGTEYRADRLPFDRIEFIDDGKAVRFRVNNSDWKCTLDSYDCTRDPRTRRPSPPDEALAAEAEEDSVAEPQTPRDARQSARSPDGKWLAFVRHHNVYLQSRAGGVEVPLTDNGVESNAYGRFSWSPDSKTLCAFRSEPGERKEVHRVESSPRSGGRARPQSQVYPLPGDRFTAHEPWVFDIATGKTTKVETDRIDFGTPFIRWKPDGSRFTYQKVDRGHQRLRVIEVDPRTAKTRNLIDEQSKTFIWTAHTERSGGNSLRYLDRTDEILYISERDGWRHLYLVDAKTGTLKNQLTRGEWVVRGVDRVDEEARQVWFSASGKNAGQDPYFLHHYRINFDGNGLVALTEGDGNHFVQFSPDRKFLVDTYSRVDSPPVHELRRTSDGKLVCALEKADISELKANGWQPPEVFVAKGRDGTTDIWGIVHRPARFDPSKKYPVIEYIYAGPHGSHVPKSFGPARRGSLAELGFVVVQVDGMGTANRSKAFHDVCWHNLKDAGFPDRILWHKALAQKYPWYDVDRIGIYGTSAGGQNSTGALLFHGDFYKAAVSACGCHDNRMDKASWNEQWMGYPVGPHYAESSNIVNAHRLRGKLLLIVGELDTNVPPESTMRLADALIKASKDFDLLVVPGMGHSDGGRYGRRRLQDFFVRHLHGVEPPDRNAP